MGQLKGQCKQALNCIPKVSIKNKIPIVASDPSNWGMAKSMMMRATQSGYDVNNQQDLNNFMLDYNQQTLANMPIRKQIRENPYKKIGRNDKISVKYSDGALKENVKFKTVEQDLIDAKCELIVK
jgi:preprotein translocase subunit SecA